MCKDVFRLNIKKNITAQHISIYIIIFQFIFSKKAIFYKQYKISIRNRAPPWVYSKKGYSIDSQLKKEKLYFLKIFSRLHLTKIIVLTTNNSFHTYPFPECQSHLQGNKNITTRPLSLHFTPRLNSRTFSSTSNRQPARHQLLLPCRRVTRKLLTSGFG